MTRVVMMALAAVLIFAGNVLAASGKIAVVDLQRAVSESREGMAARTDLLKKTEQFNAELKILLADIEKMRAELEKDGARLTVDERSEKERALQKKARDFQNRQREAQEEVKQIETEHLKRLVARLKLLMTTMGEEEKYSAILDRGTGVFYNGKESDVTAQLVKRADELYGRP